MENIRKFEPLWGTWRCEKVLGEGGFGRVYMAVRREDNHTYYSAVKHISVPANEQQLHEVRTSGYYNSEKEVSKYFEAIVRDVRAEIDLMYTLKANANIVSYEDHLIIPKPDGVGGDIFIRMELLTPLNEVLNNNLTQNDVVKIGTDICTALEICAKSKIIHRDIKPSNIFVNSNGDYKLGDFGIARVMGGTTTGVSKKGTYSYMAPEIYKCEPANLTSDIYSLGVVLYRILNNNRLPFMPLEGMLLPQHHEAAMIKMVSGAPMPPPKNATPQMAAVILKACAYNKRDRFQSATEFKNALNDALKGEYYDPKAVTVGGAVTTYDALEEITQINSEEETVVTCCDEVRKEIKEEKKGRKKGILAIGFAIIFLVAGVVLFFTLGKSASQENKMGVLSESDSLSVTEKQEDNITKNESTSISTTNTAATTIKTETTSKQTKETQNSLFSEWKSTLPDNVISSEYIIETKTQYRYRDKSEKSSSESSLSGWTLASKELTGYSDWGEWSDWSTTVAAESETCEVETQMYEVYQPIYVYSYAAYGSRRHYCIYCAFEQSPSAPWVKYTVSSDYRFEPNYSGLSCEHCIDGKVWYDPRISNKQYYICESTGGEIIQKQEYRYRTREEIYTYYYYKWGSWSEYSDKKYTASSTRDVETRKLYRYKKK